MPPPTSLPTTTTLTLAYFYNALRARLGASFWLDAELRLYVQEAIRTWNAAAAFYRYRIPLTTEVSEIFYDLTTKLTGILTHTLKDSDLVTVMEYHLLEPATPASWTGTDMFTLDELTRALERRRNQLLGESGIELRNYEPSVTKATNGRVTLQDSVLDIRRAAWKSSGAVYTPLWRDDESNLAHFSPGWPSTPATPSVYSIIASPPFTIQLAPPMSENGALNLLVTAAGEILNPVSGVSLGIPDDFAWVPKWGALADLFSKDSQARDPTRAQYCELRWREGVELARLYSPVVAAKIAGTPVETVSLHDLDADKPGWMNSTVGPSMVALAGGNILSLDSVPDSATYELELDLVGKAPVSVSWGQVGMTWDEATKTWGDEGRTWDEMLKWGEANVADDESLNITNEVADAIIDYAHHLACFKLGGQEFLATVPAYQRLMHLAAVHNERLAANAANFDVLSGQSLKETLDRPRRTTDLVAAEVA